MGKFASMKDNIITVIIPAYNEEKSIGKVIQDIPGDSINHVIVVNNNSTDNTTEVAKNAGAIVLSEDRKGYGWACLKGIEYSKTLQTDIIVFMDGDYSDYPEEITKVLAPILEKDFDMVIGSRVLGKR